MRIFVNKHIKRLFGAMLGIWGLLIVLTQVFLICNLGELSLALLFLELIGMSGCFVVMYIYFQRQDTEIEKATKQIDEFLSQKDELRINSDEEGELYRLFNTVNNMGAVLSAHADKQGREKAFLKDTISDISHQLKTPIAALSIYNGLLEDSDDIDESRELAKQSEKELDRINILVQNLLKITRFDAGSVILNKKNENIAEIMRDIELHFTYRAKLEEKIMRLSGEDEVWFNCDRDWLMEAIDNLVKNAFDHTKSKDEISIEWKRLSNAMIKISVSDNGCGIHPEDIYHIFKRFYRSRFSKDTQGLGLGLPLAKNIIDEHGGTIEVDSELGKGTTFSIFFPTKL